MVAEMRGLMPSSLLNKEAPMKPQLEFYRPRARAVWDASREWRAICNCSSGGPDEEHAQALLYAWNEGLAQLHPFYGAKFDGPGVMIFGSERVATGDNLCGTSSGGDMKFHKWKIIESGEWYDDFECSLCERKGTRAPDQTHSFPFADGCPKGTSTNGNGVAYEISGRPK